MTADEERALRALAGFRASLDPLMKYPDDYRIASTATACFTVGDLEAAERALKANFSKLADESITIFSTERQLVAFGNGDWEARGCKNERSAYVWLCERQIMYASNLHRTDAVQEELTTLGRVRKALLESKDRIEASVLKTLLDLVQDNGEGWFIIPLLEDDYNALD